MGSSHSQHETIGQLQPNNNSTDKIVNDQFTLSKSDIQLKADVALINENRIKKMVDQLDLDIKDASYILHEYSTENASTTTLNILRDDFNMLKEKRNLINNELTKIHDDRIKADQNIPNISTIRPKFVECFELKCPNNSTQHGTTCKYLFKSFQLKCPDKFIQQGTSCGYLVDALSGPVKYPNSDSDFCFW